MPDNLREFMGLVVYTTGDGQTLTVGNIFAVLLLLVGGYLVSRFIGHLFGQPPGGFPDAWTTARP